VTELVPHKRIELAAQAASEAGQRLKVVGGGPELPRLREKYRKRVEFLGRVEDEELVELYAHARALVLPNVEEFGIAAVEAQAAGRPVIAAAAGGALETVRHGVTGQLVPPDDGSALKRTLREFDAGEFDAGMIREHAEHFSAEAFRARFGQEVGQAIADGEPRAGAQIGPFPARREDPMPSEPPVFAASAGGHLDLLLAIAPDAVDGPEPVWVTSQTPRGERLRREHLEVELLPEYGRSGIAALRNILGASWVVLRRRPRTVVTSGAGVVAPFCVLARLAGARLVYLETMARVSSPSLTARLLSRLAARVIVQWPELASSLPRAEVCRPTLLEGVGERSPAAGAGTFVAVGTHAQPYTRLLEIVRRAVEAGTLPTPVYAQVGPAEWTVPGAEATSYMGRDELEAAVRTAAVVVCHGGAGIISSALAAGRRPIVVARRAALGEHVDDHQEQLTGKLAEWDMVVAADGRITAADVESAQRPVEVPAQIRERPSAADVLRDVLED
jgi:UDP-N-acetylglucosamine--N-acetylmuramyl-(pentapeptide) pyrophosphoryl-undecaprenol N-acetylglucosamine transferase